MALSAIVKVLLHMNIREGSDDISFPLLEQ